MWNDSYPFSFWEMRPSKILEDMMERDFADAEDILNRVFRTTRQINSTDIFKSNDSDGNIYPYYYGYQITVGPDGKPHVKEFGNIRPSAKGLVEQTAVRTPLVDTTVDEKQNTLRVTAEIPGVNKEDIKVNVSDKNITIHAEKGHKKYHTNVPVDVELDTSSSKATYANGILDLNIKLKHAVKEKAKDIKVQ